MKHIQFVAYKGSYKYESIVEHCIYSVNANT